MSRKDKCAIVVKAQPHRSSKYSETVCCAGIGADGKWRRQYPVPFRILNDNQKFKRWSWIEYDYTDPGHDLRFETQRVAPDTPTVTGMMKPQQRIRILNPLIRNSFADADDRGESLMILRPQAIDFKWTEKTKSEMIDEARKHADLANQPSFFAETAEPLTPCPYQFSLTWKDQDGKRHRHECDDWESTGAFFNFQRLYETQEALRTLKSKYEDEYMEAGIVLAFSTHSRRNIHHGMRNQWLLVGLIRLDFSQQTDMFLD